MFDRTQPSKRSKSWRADPGLLSGSHRGFAATRWGGADDGFMVDDIKRTKDGFALDEYAQVPLSPQAIAALKRLQALEPDDNVVITPEVLDAPEPFQVETWNANAHLPFVADVYDLDWDDTHSEQVTSELLQGDHQPSDALSREASAASTPNETTPTEPSQEASAAADVPPASLVDASSLAALEDDALPDDVLPAKARPEEVVTEEPMPTEARVEEASVDEALPTTQANSEEPLPAEVDQALRDVTPDGALAQSLKDNETAAEEKEAATETHEVLQAEAHADTDTAPDIGTVDQEQASDAPAEAEQAAQEEQAQPLLAEATEPQGMEDVGSPEPILVGVPVEEVAQREAEKFAEGLAQGIEQGERQARDAMQQEVQAQCDVLANVSQALHALLDDSQAFYEPLKRLALHLAEQIVKTELQTSTKALEQLIQTCLNELDHPAQGLVVLELNPEDKSRLQAQSPELIRGMRLEAVQDMQPGSVRLFANDAVVEDLVEHRLETLAHSMLRDVTTWKAQSQWHKPDRSAQDMESEDVHP